MSREKKLKKIIIALSIVIPLAVAALFSIPPIEGYDTTFLPQIYAGINGVTACLLIVALMAIKNKLIALHERIMKFNIGLSTLFLVLYIIRHLTASETIFGDANHDGVLSPEELIEVGASRGVYIFLLLTHILFSIVIIPLVLFTYMRALLKQIPLHKKWARISFPIWLYVAITGVVIYIMIEPYYS